MTMQTSLTGDCEIPLTAASVPLRHEAFWALEWISLRASGVYRGEGVPRGNDEPVIVVPGFLGSYAGLRELTGWLRRIGYLVVDPGFQRNIECPDTLLDRLQRRIALLRAYTNQRVRLIGHSLGGSLARAAAFRMPDDVEQVITLGSPLHEMRAHPLVIDLARLLEAVTPSRHAPHAGHEHGATCACELAEALALDPPPSVRRTAIYTRRDGVVDWHSCREEDSSVDVAVDATHLGLVVNAAVYRTIARVLAAGDGGLRGSPALSGADAS